MGGPQTPGDQQRGFYRKNLRGGKEEGGQGRGFRGQPRPPRYDFNNGQQFMGNNNGNTSGYLPNAVGNFQTPQQPNQFGSMPQPPIPQFNQMTGQTTQQNAPNQNHNARQNPNYKTDMCKFYEQRKQCPYLNRCCFAHGKKELRPKPPQPNDSQMKGYNQQQN